MTTVGKLLRDERLKQNLTLKQVEKALRVREKFIVALEEDNWNVFSSKVYITGLITNYSRLLGVNNQKMLLFFRRDYAKKEDVRFKSRTSSKYLASPTRRIAMGALMSVLFLFVLYFTYQLKLFLAPPKTAIVAPQRSTFRSGEKITVTGKTEKDAAITIFGERVYQDKDGTFTYDFPIKDGKNELIIETTGANGRKSVIKREFMGT